MALFEISGIDDFVDTANLVAKTYPKEVKKFMQSEGTKLKNRTVKTAKSTVGEKTGNYLKGIKRGKHYKYSGNGADSIRVYSGRPAYHGHLVEYGHEMVTHSRENEQESMFRGIWFSGTLPMPLKVPMRATARSLRIR